MRFVALLKDILCEVELLGISQFRTKTFCSDPRPKGPRGALIGLAWAFGVLNRVYAAAAACTPARRAPATALLPCRSRCAGCVAITGFKASSDVDHAGDDIGCRSLGSSGAVDLAQQCYLDLSCAAFNIDNKAGHGCLKTCGSPTKSSAGVCFYTKRMCHGYMTHALKVRVRVDTGAPKRSSLVKFGVARGPILVNFGPPSRPVWAPGTANFRRFWPFVGRRDARLWSILDRRLGVHLISHRQSKGKRPKDARRTGSCTHCDSFL